MHSFTLLEEHVHHFLKDVSVEYREDQRALEVIRKYIREGTITSDDEHLLKTQLSDSLKIIGIGVPFVLIPGASILMPIVLKVAEKHHIAILPAAFNNNTQP